MDRLPLNPALENSPLLSLAVGRIPLAYGEIELLVTYCLGNALQDLNVALRVIFRHIGETARFGIADALMKKAFDEIGLASEYADAIGAARHCTKLRNQYSHCDWGQTDSPEPGAMGIYFANLKECVDQSTGDVPFWFLHVDLALLEDQWDFMRYTADCLTYINYEFRTRKGWITGHTGTMPERRAPAILHNPPLEHVPWWLSEEDKARHVEHFQPPAPTVRHPPEPKPPTSRERRQAEMWHRELREVRRRIVRVLVQKPE